ncbi:MAG: DUF3791 domain-containing protein [Candidatus Margulisbacteria bacterium]|jgi:hypothetical protein|nr:DUF3791 domain-containing protein [Candidatus Margulisiibacteriota bacterium]
MSKVSFLAFCVEMYAEHKGLSSPEVYALFTRSGLLDLLKTDYADLHGMSFEYLNQFFDKYLEGECSYSTAPQ